MRAEHPAIAKRWTSEYGSFHGSQNFKPSPVSKDSPTPAKLPGLRRDFKNLTPSHVARHTPKRASEAEAMAEGSVQAHIASRPGEKMSLKDGTSGFALRDSKLAGRKRI